jgi:predicted sulfurtransferase
MKVYPNLRGTILLAHEGINGMLSGEEGDVRSFWKDLTSYPVFKELVPKESWSHEIAFRRALVKIKKEIVPSGLPGISPAQKTGPRVFPKELKLWLDENPNLVMIDTRNDYEIEYGTFKNAVTFPLKKFRTFPDFIRSMPDEVKKNKVVMFCTGGIRCEKATAIAMELGFEQVYQLEGGLLKYFEEVGQEHYDGGCFVFDRRVSVDSKLKALMDG